MRRVLLIASIVLACGAPAAAATTPQTVIHAKRTSTVTVVGSVGSTCTLTTTAFSVTMGVGYIHSPGNTVLQQGTLSVKCTKGAHAQIGMNAGLYGSAAGTQFGSRSMRDAYGDYLGYELCHDSACSSVWSASGYNYVSPGDKGTTLPVWTRITTGQSKAKQGSYSDAVTVTISF